MEYLIFQKQDRRGIITLNRPEKRNALHPDLVAELSQVLDEAQQDADVKVIIIRANGPAFCAGADLAYLQDLQGYTYEENLQDSVRLKDFFYKLYSFPKPVIAEVAGAALAGGAGFLSVCDFVHAVPDAQIGYTEVRIGFIPAIVSPFLIKKVGEGFAKEMLLSGSLYSASELEKTGFVTRMVSADELAAEVWRFSNQLIESNAANAMALTKQLILVQDQDLEIKLKMAAELNAKARGTKECQQGIAAFLNKQKLIW